MRKQNMIDERISSIMFFHAYILPMGEPKSIVT